MPYDVWGDEIMHKHELRSRREFLRESIAAVAVGTVGAAWRAEAQGAAEPPALKIACRDALLAHTGEPNIFSTMRAAGVDGTEATVNPDCSLPLMYMPDKSYSIAGPDRVKELADELTKQKKEISAFCILNRFDIRTEDELALTIKTAKVAVELGVPVVRIDLVQQKIKDIDEFVPFCIKIGRRLVEATRGMPVRFGVENHGRTTNRPEFLRKVFGGIGSKRFGITLDVGNFYWYGHPLSKLYDIYTEFAPWACHFHAKSIAYPKADQERRREPGWKYSECRCPVYEGDIDYKRVMAILRKSNYRGALCIDDESIGTFPQAQRRDVIKKDADFLRRIARGG